MPANFKSILLGQVLSVLDTGFGVFATVLLMLGLQLPLFQLFIFYAVLALVYSPILLYLRCSSPSPIYSPMLQRIPDYEKGVPISPVTWGEVWRVFFGAVTDSQGNFLVVLSYNYTSLTSVFILMNSSVPYVMILSYLFLNKRYRGLELAGVAVALAGIVCIILSDLNSQGWQWTGYFVGDLMVLAGTLVYCM